MLAAVLAIVGACVLFQAWLLAAFTLGCAAALSVRTAIVTKRQRLSVLVACLLGTVVWVGLYYRPLTQRDVPFLFLIVSLLLGGAAFLTAKRWIARGALLLAAALALLTHSVSSGHLWFYVLVLGVCATVVLDLLLKPTSER
ncbi:MAG TPA: hypothetical protein VHP33_23965 [Polyangiaceae bacterium]|nr:hypothetical protein [Polyangiaceae bacterium]